MECCVIDRESSLKKAYLHLHTNLSNSWSIMCFKARRLGKFFNQYPLQMAQMLHHYGNAAKFFSLDLILLKEMKKGQFHFGTAVMMQPFVP